MTSSETTQRSNARHPEAGFTLVELLVSVAVLAAVIIGVLALFDFANQVAAVQTDVAEMQQSARIGQHEMTRLTRMAGRGGLPSYLPDAPAYGGMFLPEGVAVSVRDNVAAGETVAPSDGSSPPVVEDSDVLTVRGVFETPIYQVNVASDPDFTLDDPAAPTSGTVTLRDPSPSGIPQDLQPLVDLVNDPRPEALVIVSAIDETIYAVAEFTGGDDSTPGEVQLSFNITGGTHTGEYLELTPTGQWPPALAEAAFVGILEEHRYYVNADTDNLATGRFYPNTDAEHPSRDWNTEIANDFRDLQVAFGLDRNGDGTATEAVDYADRDTDEWLLNHSGDDLDPAVWNQPGIPLYYVRINALADTDRPSPKYVSEPIDQIENHEYNEPDTPAAGDRVARMHRRHQVQTTINPRNVN